MKSLGLLLLQEQPSRVLPRMLSNTGLETMPGDALGDTGHTLLRNPCTVMPKSRSFSGREPQHWLSYRSHHQRSCRRRVPHPISLDIRHLCKFPWPWLTPGALAGDRAGKKEHKEGGKVFGNMVLITLSLYQHVSFSDSTWTFRTVIVIF